MKKTKKLKWEKPTLKKLSYKELLEDTIVGDCYPGSTDAICMMGPNPYESCVDGSGFGGSGY